jgi:hypothetical protein
MLGRDPYMDQAIARVARNLYEFEHEPEVDLEVAHQLKTAARRLWGATNRLPPVCRQIVRPAVRAFIVICKEAEHKVRIGGEVSPGPIHGAFAQLVSEYRITRLDRQVENLESGGSK